MGTVIMYVHRLIFSSSRIMSYYNILNVINIILSTYFLLQTRDTIKKK